MSIQMNSGPFTSEDSPAFTLVTGDPIAPAMVVMWACFRNGDLAGALDEFNRIAQDHVDTFADNPTPEAVVQGAVAVAEAMEEWQGG